MKEIIVAGNWKMNKTYLEAKEFIARLNKKELFKTKVVLAVPSLYLDRLVENNEQPTVYIAAQNCNENKSGAFTGEVSSHMLASIGVQYSIIGHSERRTLYGETNETIAKKILQCLHSNVKPILCVGETLEEREKEETYSVIKNQLESSLAHVDISTIEKIIIAYEPVWAIGTGKTATNDQAQEVHKFIFNWLMTTYSPQIAEKIPILYGGSCNLENAKDLFSQKNIWGGLIGGASLDLEVFSKIINLAEDLNRN